MKVVIKLSGKFVSPLDDPKVQELAKVIDRLSERHEIGVVVGGGSIARKYISLSAPNKFLRDVVGIETARLNALVLATHVKNAYLPIPRSPEEVMKALMTGKVVILGGLQPGQSTNAVSLLLAELMEADLVVNVTNVDAVYDRPPTELGAKKLEKVKVDELMEILRSSGWSADPGRYELIDEVAAQLLKRSGIPVAVINGNNPENIIDAVERKKWGTLIIP